MAANVPEDAVQDILNEWKGGKCLQCGKEYQERPAKNRYADFHYFVPTCECKKSKMTQEELEKEIKAKLRIACVPELYINVNLTNWDYSVQQKTNDAFKAVYDYVKDMRFLKQKGIVLYGDVGCGKTRCGISILYEVAKTDKTFLFRLMSDLINQLTTKREEWAINEILRYDVILFDDIDKISGTQSWIKERLFRVLDKLISSKKVVIATANFIKEEDFLEKLGDANTSRLVFACQFVKFSGDDYRIKKTERLDKKTERK